MDPPRFEYVDFWSLPSINGPAAKYFWLGSSDNESFIVPAGAIALSRTLFELFQGPPKESPHFRNVTHWKVEFSHVPADVLYLIVKALFYGLQTLDGIDADCSPVPRHLARQFVQTMKLLNFY